MTDALEARALAKSFREHPRFASLKEQALMREAMTNDLTRRLFINNPRWIYSTIAGWIDTKAHPTLKIDGEYAYLLLNKKKSEIDSDFYGEFK